MIGERLADKTMPWTLELQQLPEGDPVGRLLAQQLSRSEITADLWVPRVYLSSRGQLDDLLSKNMRPRGLSSACKAGDSGLVTMM